MPRNGVDPTVPENIEDTPEYVAPEFLRDGVDGNTLVVEDMVAVSSEQDVWWTRTRCGSFI